ncbi:type IV pilin protein [uncultured Paraglaciecola sp.]|uniref:type IV pilin protein n=1 Tax=uncultured Paraglaciecola sp. TaxID=1765024 RepID=UPI0025CE96DD|nr:type IV pilin protein [uncultured Paraglaciecola sp.]
MLVKVRETNIRYNAELYAEFGMTLIELMVVVIIIGVLATLVFPSFEQQILNSRRGDGITHLLRLKLQQEAYRIENISYAKTEQLSLPPNEYYIFIVTDVSATTYTLTAKAKGSQTSDDTCLAIHIDQSMNKTPAHCFF